MSHPCYVPPDLGAGHRPRCRHCNTRPPAPRRRGLCRRCYYDPNIRAVYGLRPRGYGVGGDRNGNRPLPDSTTDAQPGSEAKVLVLIERASKRQQLFHPSDLHLHDVAEAFDDGEPALLHIAGRRGRAGRASA